MSTRFVTVDDTEMPDGHDWVRLDYDDGGTVVLVRASCLSTLPGDDGDGAPAPTAMPRPHLLTCQHVNGVEGGREGDENMRPALKLVM